MRVEARPDVFAIREAVADNACMTGPADPFDDSLTPKPTDPSNWPSSDEPLDSYELAIEPDGSEAETSEADQAAWPPAYPSAPPTQPTASATAPKQTHGLAIASLVLGIASWVGCWLLFSIPAVICGHLAKNRIQSDPYQTGEGLATAGLILGYINIGLSVLLIGLYVILVIVMVASGG